MRAASFAPRTLAIHAIVAGALLEVCPPPAARAQDPAAPAAQAAPAPVRRVGEVAVTAARSERGVLEVPGNVTVIERETIERSGARDVPELLRREAGLYVTNDTGNPEGYRIEGRGFNNGGGNGSSLLVLMDGRRLNEADSSQIDWSLVHIDRVERVEIVRGPANSLYGDNALSGVIQLFTRRTEGTPQITLTGRGGSFDTGEGSLYVGGGAGRFSGTLFADLSHSDGFRERSDFDVHSFAGTLRWMPADAASFELSSGYSSDRRKRPGTLEIDEIDRLGRDGADPSADDNGNDARERWVQLVAEFALADDVTLTIQPTWRRRNDSGAVATSDSFSATDFDFTRNARSWGLTSQIEWTRPIGERTNSLIGGYDLLTDKAGNESVFAFTPVGDLTSLFPAEGSARRHLHGLFVQDELGLTEDLTFSAGLRFDRAHYSGSDPQNDLDFRRNEHVWSPKAALVWRIVEPASAYLSYSRGFRFPNFDEAFGVFGFTPELGAQTSNAYETGFKFRNEWLAANVAFYWMDVKDEIVFNHEIDAFGFPSPQNVNVDQVRHRGIELWASWRPRPWLELYGSYTFDDSQIEDDPLTGLDGNQLPITPRNRGTVGTRILLPWHFEFGTNVNLVGRRYLANDLRNELPQLGQYYTIDLVGGWRGPVNEHLDLEVLGRVYNLTDREYVEFAGEGTFSRGVIGYNPAPGRSYQAIVSLGWRP